VNGLTGLMPKERWGWLSLGKYVQKRLKRREFGLGWYTKLYD
jgi:hypothetical protein